MARACFVLPACRAFRVTQREKNMIITAIIRIIIDAIATGFLWLAVRLSCTCCQQAKALQWRRETLRRLSKRRQC
jgi:hypothetical protein